MVVANGQQIARRRFALRLDDGTLISGCKKHTNSDAPTIVCLRPEQAFESGFLHEAELLRAQSLLCEVHAKLPEAGPLKSFSTGTKRSLDSVLEVGQAVSGKRSRSTGVVAPTNGYHDTAAAPGKRLPASPPAVVQPEPQHAPPPTSHAPEITSFGLACLKKISKMLGPSAYIFEHPVNGKIVVDYYDIIKNPICLVDIKKRLQQGSYSSMADFYEDMYLLVSNCYTYNKAGTQVHQLGVKIESMFKGDVRKAGHGHLVRTIKPQARTAAPRRAHPRLDDDDFDDDEYRPAKRAASQRAGPLVSKAKGKQTPARPAQKAAGVGANVARTKSVNSYKAFQPLPEEKQAQLAEALSNEDVLAEKMEGVVEILQRANELGASEDGEVELDLSVLSPQTVWQLYEYIFGAKQAAAAAPAAPQRSGSGFQLEQDSDYDPDEEDDE